MVKYKDKMGVKLHTGEHHGPNIIPPRWVKVFMEKELPDGTIVETNTFYEGDRYTTERHRKTAEVNGWTEFTSVDITDEHWTAMLPVIGGKWFREMSMGRSLLEYDSMAVLTHFKGRVMGGFGGASRNWNRLRRRPHRQRYDSCQGRKRMGRSGMPPQGDRLVGIFTGILYERGMAGMDR